MRLIPRTMGMAAAMLAVAVPGAAQTPASIVGVVTDSLNPLPDATIEVFGAKQRLATLADGKFRFDGLKPGPHWIQVRRIGYTPVAFSLTLFQGQQRNVEVVLEPAPYRLPDYEVKGGMTQRRYWDFYWRSRSAATGKFYTRDDIARLQPFDVIDLAQRGLPGRTRWDLEQINWSPPGRPGARTGGDWADVGGVRDLSVGCPPSISVNGTTPWPGSSLRDFDLAEVEALEVYRSRGLPIEFQGGAGGCGLVVVWLR